MKSYCLKTVGASLLLAAIVAGMASSAHATTVQISTGARPIPVRNGQSNLVVTDFDFNLSQLWDPVNQYTYGLSATGYANGTVSQQTCTNGICTTSTVATHSSQTASRAAFNPGNGVRATFIFYPIISGSMRASFDATGLGAYSLVLHDGTANTDYSFTGLGDRVENLTLSNLIGGDRYWFILGVSSFNLPSFNIVVKPIAAAPVSAVPLPGSLGLYLSGLLGFLGFAGFKKRSR